MDHLLCLLKLFLFFSLNILKVYISFSVLSLLIDFKFILNYSIYIFFTTINYFFNFKIIILLRKKLVYKNRMIAKYKKNANVLLKIYSFISRLINLFFTNIIFIIVLSFKYFSDNLFDFILSKRLS